MESFLADLRQKPVIVALLLFAATLLVYAPVAHYAFLDLDDSSYISKSPHVLTGLSLHNLVWAFKDFDTFYWHPVTWISHMTDCQLFGANAGAHHLVNVAFHLANTLLLFFLLFKATSAFWRSFVVAGLFALHPLNVETVAWVAERKSLLCTFFSFLTFAAYGWYAKEPNWKRYLVVVGALLFALMAKPMAVTVPLLLLLFDFWPLKRYEELSFSRRWARLSLEKLPLLLLSVASSAITIVGHRAAMASLSAVPLHSRLQNAVISLASYVVRVYRPRGLSAFYPLPAHSALTLFGAITLLLMITGMVIHFRRAQYPVVGWATFVFALLPVSGIIQVGGACMADRFTYLPAVGVFVITVWACSEILQRLRIPQLVTVIVCVSVLLACAAASRYYLAFWHDGITLFTRVRQVAEHPDPMIEEYFADALANAGRADEAFSHYRESCDLQPNGDLCHYNMAEYLFSRYRLSEAVEQYRISAALTSKRDVALSSYLNSADALMTMGDYQSAELELSRALEMDPNNARALALRQQALNRNGK